MSDPPPSAVPTASPPEAVSELAVESADGGRKSGEKLLALAVLACLLFNPPLMRAFGAPVTVLGWPLLYVYVFTVWGVVIALAGLLVDRSADHLPRGR